MRSKDSKQTIEKILTVATTLFSEKGFDKTSIQDIVDSLGMSRGAIFHHFKSKEDILEAVMERQFNYTYEMLEQLVNSIDSVNSRDKLTKILERIASDKNIHSIDDILNYQIKNPQFIVQGIKASVNKEALIFTEIMKQGIADGSITTEYPNECAEVFMLLMDVWTNPILFNRKKSETINRIKFLQHMMRQLGVDIVSDQLIKELMNHYPNIELGGINE
ncbi:MULTISPECIES: TetR/AcrR family transcriptional regulator [Bacillus]|uniref:TetR/AcrR family transcriptional regulator n=1 Tax=Bacillus TaxID=1386 RepID=UPI002248DB3A|nr:MULTISPECIES: TetR/AcrR family transcriptional regulator [Bacillus]MCX2829695.1 TetR/AcrR family transcriptional regulator [Bacillus sp. DHT2]MDR4918850.1 TetR/AcrR family transcriptional regulator [Bacillus pseudomycoides]